MNSNEGKQKFFVIYQITNLLDNRIYVGAHATFNINDKYMGSSKYLKKDLKELGRQNFRKDILHIFDNKEDMMKKEAEIVNKEFCHRSDTYNKIVGGADNFSTLGMVVVKDDAGNSSIIYKNDPRYLSGELQAFTKNTINVKDSDGNIFRILKDDPKFLSRELVGYSKYRKQHINASQLGKHHSTETKKKIGLANSIKQSGEGNSQYGTYWVTNGIENKKIKKELLEDYLKKGYIQGRK